MLIIFPTFEHSRSAYWKEIIQIFKCEKDALPMFVLIVDLFLFFSRVGFLEDWILNIAFSMALWPLIFKLR